MEELLQTFHVLMSYKTKPVSTSETLIMIEMIGQTDLKSV